MTVDRRGSRFRGDGREISPVCRLSYRVTDARDICVAQLDQAGAAEAGFVAAVYDLDREGAQPFHRRDVHVDVGVVVAVEQRSVVHRVAGEERPEAASQSPIESGEWPGRCKTSNVRSPRSMTSPSSTVRVGLQLGTWYVSGSNPSVGQRVEQVIR